MKFATKPPQAGKRIDKFLSKKLKNLSRSQIQKLIKQESIIVNKKPTIPHYPLKTGDIIEVLAKKTKVGKSEEETKKQNLKIKIIADTPEYLVIDKPAGLITHGADYIKETALSDLILKKYPEIKKIGEDTARPGIVHRLDKEVSGVMVIAKTQNSFENLKKQFKARMADKKYIALVYGNIMKDKDEITFPLSRSSAGGKMAALPITVRGEKNISGKQAITEIEIKKRFVNFSLIKIIIKTGRTHQIRAHLAAYGHPIVGDNLYSTKKTRALNKKIGLSRMFLFASELSFFDLNGKKLTFKTTIPLKLKNFLEKINI